MDITFRGANVALSFNVPSPKAAYRRGVADANMPQPFKLGVAHHCPSLDPSATADKHRGARNDLNSRKTLLRGHHDTLAVSVMMTLERKQKEEKNAAVSAL